VATGDEIAAGAMDSARNIASPPCYTPRGACRHEHGPRIARPAAAQGSRCGRPLPRLAPPAAPRRAAGGLPAMWCRKGGQTHQSWPSGRDSGLGGGGRRCRGVAGGPTGRRRRALPRLCEVDSAPTGPRGQRQAREGRLVQRQACGASVPTARWRAGRNDGKPSGGGGAVSLGRLREPGPSPRQPSSDSATTHSAPRPRQIVGVSAEQRTRQPLRPT